MQLRGIAALADDDLAQRLNFTEEQRKAVVAKLQEGQKQFASLRGKAGRDARERFEMLREIQQETEAAVLSMLTQKQRERFDRLRGEAFDQNQMFKVPEQPKTGAKRSPSSQKARQE